MPQFNFRNKISGRVETAAPREARNIHIAREVCDAWCKMTKRMPELYEPIFVERAPTVSVIFEQDKRAGFAQCL